MYRTNDPRFRRRLNELGQTVERANESAQSGLYIFGQHYIRPCLESVGACLTTCVDASCPSLNLSQRDRLRRQRGRARSRGRAELSFDFYDDWDEEGDDGLLGWGGNDEFDRLLAGSGGAGYGAVTQPARQKGAMVYPKARRKSAVPPHDGGPDPTVIPGTRSFLGSLFGGKALRYKPSAADLQEHPGAGRRHLTEGEALLEESETSELGGVRRHRRARSGTAGTAGSRETMDSLSSRGDIFPSDEELDDAVPLDDEFAMVLERRTTLSAPETESSSNKTRSERKRGKRPSAGSRTSTRRTQSLRSRGSSTGLRSTRSRGGSSAAQTPVEERETTYPAAVEEAGESMPTMSELKREEHVVAQMEEEEVERKRLEAQKLAAERGLVSDGNGVAQEEYESKEATPKQANSPTTTPTRREEPSQLPTPLPTDDEEEDDNAHQLQQQGSIVASGPNEDGKRVRDD